jgi:ribosome biogenesis GTPase
MTKVKDTMTTGIITKGIGGFYYVLTHENVLIECKARGRFRKDKITPMVGDRVKISLGREGYGLLDEILERRNQIIRPPVSNVDQLLIVAAVTRPDPDYYLIDKICAIAAIKNIEPVVVINKCDLADPTEMERIYKRAGFRVLSVSCRENRGLEEVKKLYYEKVSVFCGSSGVGKSSIINLTLPDISMAVGAISPKIERGRHTTRHVQLFPVEGGGFVADTPGFSSFDFEQVEYIPKENLQYAFPDFEEYIGQCRFTGCSHTTEPDCAIQEAVASGKIEKSRFESYCSMFEEVKNRKEWEKKH